MSGCEGYERGSVSLWVLAETESCEVARRCCMPFMWDPSCAP